MVSLPDLLTSKLHENETGNRHRSPLTASDQNSRIKLIDDQDQHYTSSSIAGNFELIQIDMLVYENPVRESINIEWNTHANGDLQIIDSWGKILYQTKVENTKAISLHTKLPEGVYFILFTDKSFKSFSINKIVVID